jgi:hypothetical protein
MITGHEANIMMDLDDHGFELSANSDRISDKQTEVLMCSWTGCKKKANKCLENDKGEKTYIYCSEHWDEVMKHLRFLK